MWKRAKGYHDVIILQIVLDYKTYIKLEVEVHGADLGARNYAEDCRPLTVSCCLGVDDAGKREGNPCPRACATSRTKQKMIKKISRNVVASRITNIMLP